MAILLTSVIVMSCDDFLDINKNPNQTTVSTPELVLTAALNNTAAQNFYNQMGAFWAGQWCPSGDVSGFVQEKTYDLNNTYGTGIWTGYYDILADYKYVIEQGTAAGKIGTASIGRIMSVYCYHKLVDTYNNVPFSEALKGTTVIRPKYDDAQSVYEALVEELDEATGDLIAIDPITDVPAGPADIVFASDYDKWILFANTLKLRLLMRQTEMSGRTAYITAEINQIQPNGDGQKFLSTDANLNPGFLKSAGKQNPFWGTYYKTENDALINTYNFIRSTAFLVTNIPTTDARLYYIVGPQGLSTQTTAVGPRKGVPYGDETPAAYSNATSGIGFGILKNYNMPVTIFTAAESYFLQSEAAFRTLMAGDAAALFTEGVRASHRLLGLSDAAADNTIANTPVAQYNGTLARIITQKWVASVGYGGFEAWCDVRRTGFPNVPLSLKAIKDNPPLRLFYPNQELQTNSGNVALQGTIDVWNDGVFWDAN